jgi:cytochrome c biogenesis protein CcmG, thiol:disulfide interchange protein DsbE
MSRRLLYALGAVAVIVLVVIGLSQTKTDNSAPEPDQFDLPAARKALTGAPAPLAALHAQSSELIAGDRDDVDARIKALKGHPIVVNKWASWCGPCRFEFPFLQQAGVTYGKEVAFIGLDSGDNDEAAAKFLKQFPVTYPSYVDRKTRIAQHFGIGQSYPTTMFYDADGKMTYAHQGNYRDEQALVADIRRYALGRAS